MREFLLRTAAFVLTMVGLVGAGIFVLRPAVNQNQHFLLDPKTRSIILGHSHAANSMNDSILTETRNLAAPTEGYFYSFVKARKIIESNPQVKNVFIEYTGNQISEYANERIFGQYLPRLFPMYFNQMNLREIGYLISKSTLPCVLTVPRIMKDDIEYFLDESKSYIDFNEWGHFIRLEHVITDREIDSSRVKMNGPAPVITHNYNVSEVNIWSLAKMVRFLRDRGIRVFFIRSPVYSLNGVTDPNCVMRELLLNEFKDIPFFDFQDFPLDRADFADMHHLNRRAAGKLSIFFEDFLRTELNSPNPEELFNRKIANLRQSQSAERLSQK
jgi:hypothetical protein